MRKFVTRPGVSLCTESFGNPADPAILLIMGAASSMVWWEIPFCQMLTEHGFFVVRFDNRDTGESTSYPPGQPAYSFEDLAEDAIAILDAYSIEKAVVMGMSMGGFLAQMIGVRHSNRLNGLVLLSTMYFAEGAENLPYSSDDVNAFFATFGQCEPDTKDGLIAYVLSQWRVTNQSSRPKDEARIRDMIASEIERSQNFASRVNHSHAQVTGDELMRIAEIGTPTLVIHGTEDVVIPYEHGQMLAKTILNARLHTMEGAGHELHPQDYEDVACKIAELFL